MPSNPLYTIELFLHKAPQTFVFELLPHKNEIKPPNMNSFQQIHWGSMFKNERPIRVCSINGSPIENGYAIAYVYESKYRGTMLSCIYLNNEKYEPEDCVEYWFPGFDHPKELSDGSLHVHINTPNNLDTGFVFLNPLDTFPFMDSDGVFAYQYMMVAKDPTLQNGGPSKITVDYSPCKIPVTMYQTGNKFNAMVRNDTMTIYPVVYAVTLREIPIYDANMLQ